MSNPQQNAVAMTAVRAISDLPGPTGLPLLGSLLQTDRARLHCTLEQWARKYGALYRCRLGPRTFVVASDVEQVRSVLQDRPHGFRRTEKMEKVFAELGYSGVFAVSDARWQPQRRMVSGALDPRHIQTYYPTLLRVTERLRQRWLGTVRAAQSVELLPDLMRYTVDVIAGLALGTDMNTIESKEDDIQADLNVIFPNISRRMFLPIPYWRYLRLPVDRDLERRLGAVRARIDALVAEARARLQQDAQRREAPPNLLEAMLVESTTPDSSLTEADIASNVATMLLAGEDTTANTLAWVLHFAAQQPEVARRLEEEAHRVLGEAPCVTRQDQVAAMQYTMACVHEALRLKPAAPFIINQALRDTRIGDLALPAGSLVLTLTRAASLSDQFFDEPAAFRPERWLDAQGQVNSRNERLTLPFGAGPRICPGRNLSLIEMVLVVSMLFRNFRIATMQSADGEKVLEYLGFVMRPSPLRMTLALQPG